MLQVFLLVVFFLVVSLSGISQSPNYSVSLSPSGSTGFDVSVYKDSNGYTLFKGSPSTWAYLQPSGYIDYQVNAQVAGVYTVQLYYATTLSGGSNVFINGQYQSNIPLPSTFSWGTYSMSPAASITLNQGISVMRISAQDNFQPFNLRGMVVSFVKGTSTVVSGSYPLYNQQFYVSPYSEAGLNSNLSCSQYYPNTSLAKIYDNAQGVWFGDWNQNIENDVYNVVTTASQKKEVPILVAYDIPDRDCGGYSSGGAASGSAYQSWIDGFATGVGNNKVVVILEPDALMKLYQTGCLTSSQQQERLSLLNYAVNQFHYKAPNALVYIDAGRAGEYQVDPSDMANRLNQAGISNAAGFSLNVSNYISTQVTTDYGNQISAGVNNKHFVIDTSRNGQGADGDLNWCNPPNRGLGYPSQGFNTGLVDGFLWVQNPGSSDGSCNGNPPAGQFSLPIACTLVHNAIF